MAATALWSKAPAMSPCSSAYVARSPPQPGQSAPVIALSGHCGYRLAGLLGLATKTYPASAAQPTNAPPALIQRLSLERSCSVGIAVMVLRPVDRDVVDQIGLDRVVVDRIVVDRIVMGSR